MLLFCGQGYEREEGRVVGQTRGSERVGQVWLYAAVSVAIIPSLCIQIHYLCTLYTIVINYFICPSLKLTFPCSHWIFYAWFTNNFFSFSRFSLDAEFHLVYFYCFDYLRLCSCILILIMFRLGTCLSNNMISCRSGSRHFTNGIMIGVDKVCSGQKYPCPFLPQNFTDWEINN